MINGSKGFTLLEVLMALAVASVVIAASSSAMVRGLDVQIRVSDRIQSLWVAKNQLEEMKITHAWPANGSYEGDAQLGGRKWYYLQEVSKTSDPDIRKVVVKVFTDQHKKKETARLTGALSDDRAIPAPRLLRLPAPASGFRQP